jgi:CubicO group peptidase (beta-lactamase class C family)
MSDLAQELDALVATSAFSGVIRVDRGTEVLVEKAYGLADRRWEIPNALDTRFAIASGVKGMTALAVVSLVADGTLALATTARSVLGDDLALIDDGVTVEHLLAHRSGIGDYVDEDLPGEITDYVLPVPVHLLAETEDYLAVLDGFPTKFAPGEQFSYCNGGFVVLALIGERASGVPFHELVRRRVCEPAGMYDTAFLRSDELPGSAALGYLRADGLRTNALHLPVRGSGDGGIYTTAADVRRLWTAFFTGRIVSDEWVREMTRPRSVAETKRYGLGFWLHATSDSVILEGYDAGVSFRSLHDPHSDLTATVVSNWSDGAWKLAAYLDDRFGAAG